MVAELFRQSRIMACSAEHQQRPSLASISGLSIAARWRAAPGWFGKKGKLRGTQLRLMGHNRGAGQQQRLRFANPQAIGKVVQIVVTERRR